MIRVMPARRVIGRAIGITFAMTIAFAAAVSADEPPAPPAPVKVPEAAKPAPAPPPAPPAKPAEDWVRKGLYFGPAVGVAHAKGRDKFGYALHVLYRPFRYGGMQLEYENLGPDKDDNGAFDGLYLGLAPMLPLTEGLTLFLQGGYTFTAGDDAPTGGGGVLWDLPLDPVKKYLPGGLTLRGDYKYFDFDKAGHLATIGLMYRFGFFSR